MNASTHSSSSQAQASLPVVSRIRRNHALEHATLHVLAEGNRNLRLVGRSSLRGFTLYGNVSAEQVEAAAQEGLHRLQSGQWRMAVHPNCGSNLAVASTLAGLGTFLALGGKKPRSLLDRLRRLPLAFLSAMAGIVLARPIGYLLQARVTTLPDIGTLQIAGVTQQQRAGILVHRVLTKA